MSSSTPSRSRSRSRVAEGAQSLQNTPTVADGLWQLWTFTPTDITPKNTNSCEKLSTHLTNGLNTYLSDRRKKSNHLSEHISKLGLCLPEESPTSDVSIKIEGTLDSPSSANIQPQNQCEICKKTFTHSHTLARHSVIHSGIRPFKCTLCDKDFYRLDKLKDHTQRHKNKKKKSLNNK